MGHLLTCGGTRLDITCQCLFTTLCTLLLQVRNDLNAILEWVGTSIVHACIDMVMALTMVRTFVGVADFL